MVDDTKPHCPSCDTDEYVVQRYGTDTGTYNRTKRGREVYVCENCGAEGVIRYDMQAGTEEYEGALFSGGDGR